MFGCRVKRAFCNRFLCRNFRVEENDRVGRAGHEPALLYNPNTDVFTTLHGNGLALGVDPYTEYQLNSHSGLPKGAIVLIGTDGLWEIDQGVWCAHCKGVIKDLVQKHQHENAVSISEIIKVHIPLRIAHFIVFPHPIKA